MIPLEDFTDVTLGCEKKLSGEKQARKLQDAQAEKLTSLQANKLTSW